MTPGGVPVDFVGFESKRPLGLDQLLNGDDFETTHELVYRDRHGREWRVPARTRTDLASVPDLLGGIIRRYGTYTAVAILHDYFWRVVVPRGDLTYREADQIFRDGLALAGVKPVRCRMMWAAVRWGALTRPGGWRGWHRDALPVLGITVISLPGVVLPVAGALPAIVWLAALEAVVGLARIGRSATQSPPRSTPPRRPPHA